MENQSNMQSSDIQEKKKKKKGKKVLFYFDCGTISREKYKTRMKNLLI